MLKRLFWFVTGLVFFLFLSGMPAGFFSHQVRAESSQEINQSVKSVSVLVNQGLLAYQSGNFQQAIALWKEALSGQLSEQDRAVVYSNLALAYQEVGNVADAIKSWEAAIEFYQKNNEPASQQQLAKLLTEQAQAYNNLGHHKRALQLSRNALKLAEKYQDLKIKAALQSVLGNAEWGLGNYDEAIARHQTSLEISQSINDSPSITHALNNLGNVYVSRSQRYQTQANTARLEGEMKEQMRLNELAQKDLTAAINSFETSVRNAPNGMSQVRALLNLNRVLSQLPNPNLEAISQNKNQVLSLLENQPASHQKVYALINLIVNQNLDNFHENLSNSDLEILQQAVAVAQKIGDDRAESFALGNLGQFYENSGNYEQAMAFTRQAQFAAQQVNAADSLYRWQWQAGRILKATGNTQPAIHSYQQAIATLQSIRGDLIAASKDLQFDFRDSVEPVYRELIDLLLTPETKEDHHSSNEENVRQALEILDLLKLAELQNFFGDECVEVSQDTARTNGQLIDSTAAVVYSVILPNYTELILEAADHPLHTYRIDIDAPTLQQEIDELRSFLEKRSTNEYLTKSQKIYNQLIRPMEADLAAIAPKTLVFVSDGVLRQIPMSALHDGQKFFIEKYPIATTPSLSLTTGKPFNKTHLQALIMGLTVERDGFAALTNVEQEVSAVKEILGGTELVNQEFTLNALQTRLEKQNYPVVHMATHGKFGVDTSSTFLLAFDTRIAVEQLDNLLRSRSSIEPVELLTLSACQTAAGDNRSALGIAGVAVRAGVKSALASLWYINDEGTVPLIEEFYRQLRRPNITKAEALQMAQLKLISDIDYNHPALWASFTIIGNWL
jgi:CHAT domain-containing protein